MRMVSIIMGLGLAVAFLGCDAQDEKLGQAAVKKETVEARDTAGGDASASREQMKAKLQNMAGRLNARLEEMKDDTGDAAVKLRSELSRRIQTVNQALSDLADASEDRWAGMKQRTAELLKNAAAWLEEDNLSRNPKAGEMKGDKE